MASRRRLVRPSLLSAAASCPWIRIEPSKPPSSSPTAWSRVDLPEPEGPSKATISPAPTLRSMPRRTWMVTPAWTKLRLRPVTSSASLIAKHLHRIGVRRLPGRIEGREEAQHQRHDDDRGDFDRIGLGRQIGEKADRGIPEILTGDGLDRDHHRLAVEKEDRAKRQA